MTAPTSETNVALMRALQASWSHPDPDRFSDLFTEDGEFEDVVYGVKLKGRSELRAWSARLKKHVQEMRIEILTCDATEETGVCEWRLFHRFTGNFDGVDRTGAPIDIRGLSVYRFAGGRIASGRDYWNYMEMIRAVQVLPRELRGLCASVADG